MNPAIINTTNVQQFGFKSIFDLENSKLTLDITSLTIFKPGGETAIVGINFEVRDPSGIFLSTIDFPSVDIDPGTGQTTYEIPLTNSASKYGWYFIKGVLREANGTDYSIEVEKNICQPKGIKKGLVEGKLEAKADCTIPRILITEATNMAYLGSEPFSFVKDGKLYYPHGTLDPVTFTYTPLMVMGSGKVYTGDYTVRNKTTALYELGDYVYVQIAYGSTLKFNVNCTSNICDILCCMEKLQSVAAVSCNSVAGRDAQKKLQSVVVPLTLALAMQQCGKDVSESLDEISKKLDCNCNCDGSESVEPRPIITTFDPVVLDGECATDAFLEDGVWKIKTKNITVVAGTPNDPAFKVSSVITDCNVTFTITLNKAALAGDILNEIKNSATLKNLFNSLIIESGLDLSALDGKCIFDTTSCQYNLIEDAADAAKLVSSVVIDGQNFNAPNGLGITNALGIKNWLDSLSFGSWNIYYDSSTTPRTTVFGYSSTEYSVSTMTFTLGENEIIKQFSKNCGGLLEILQAIFDYLCGLDDTQVKLSQSYTLCFVDNQGVIQQTTVSTTNSQGQPNSINTLLNKAFEVMCISFANLKNIIQVNCAVIKQVFVANDAIISTDGVYGTRNGKCGLWTISDLATQVVKHLLTTNDTALIEDFCAVRNRCVAATCNPITYAEVELIEACPAVTTINGQFTS